MTHPMIVHDAKEAAGQFFERNRSRKFRANWPIDTEFVAVKWPHFVEGVRKMYASLCGDPSVDEYDKVKMFEALTNEAPRSFSDAASSPLPIVKGTEAFEGDKRENMRTTDAFGVHAENVTTKLLSTTALFTG